MGVCITVVSLKWQRSQNYITININKLGVRADKTGKSKIHRKGSSTGVYSPTCPYWQELEVGNCAWV